MLDKWKNLPNSEHIYKIILSAQADKSLWDLFFEDTDILDATWHVAYDIIKNKHSDFDISIDGYPMTVGDAVTALVAWEDCSYLLYSNPDEVSLLAKLGDPKALLLLAACKVFNQEGIKNE